ncbi:MAG: LysE family transporter [Fretibacterium sp.]|nr:LysE family transporter [Fretibacterium sp.]
MLLQLAVGPMCLMVFNTAKGSGFWIAFSLVSAIALVDAFYIILAAFGISRLLEEEHVRKIIQFFGGFILVLFGLNIILGVFHVSIIPGLNVKITTGNIFLQGLVLTLSNPLTIVFWGGVLTAKIAENDMNKIALAIFSSGLVSATLFFLTTVAGFGTVVSTFLPERISDLLNMLVGAVLMWLGLRMMSKKK